MFTTRTNMLSHVGIHTGERNFKCETCGAAFTASSSLSNHRKIHKKENPVLKCKECGIVLADMAMLKNHMRDHQNIVMMEWNGTHSESIFSNLVAEPSINRIETQRKNAFQIRLFSAVVSDRLTCSVMVLHVHIENHSVGEWNSTQLTRRQHIFLPVLTSVGGQTTASYKRGRTNITFKRFDAGVQTDMRFQFVLRIEQLVTEWALYGRRQMSFSMGNQHFPLTIWLSTFFANEILFPCVYGRMSFQWNWVPENQMTMWTGIFSAEYKKVVNAAFYHQSENFYKECIR